MRLCVLLVEKALELLHTISILPVLKEVHLPYSVTYNVTKLVHFHQMKMLLNEGSDAYTRRDDD